METRLGVWSALILALLVSGCDPANRAELERTRTELSKTRAELAQLQARQVAIEKQAAAQSYLEELEKLDSLKTKGVLTQEEFDHRKQAILEGQKLSTVIKPEPSATGMDDLAKQLRTLQSLYNSSAINLQERDAKRAQLIKLARPATDMKKDLETVQALYNETAITLSERDALKQKLLELDAGTK